MTTELTTALAAQRVLPVLREPDPAAAVARFGALLAAGCRVIELTTTIPDWPAALGDCVRLAAGQALIGMGTVTTAAQADIAIDRGAAFLVSPYPSPAVRVAAAGTPFVEGGFTPAEIAAAAEFGPAKVFPAHVGGPAFIRSLLAVLPGAQLIPTGGIAAGQVGDYLAAGALAVGVGSGLPDDPAELAAVFARES
ncbi:MAG TPA: bifunctional 4-hydroxy-2-oxoglutarate aldolase/2-dehydro-3-deoxy-phosphogluconate aldolase [Pseudonocardiaceae bacterium]|jgi:2-dehydro-3-deoxyphosphogluconate aldolase/(4S)-4-hydroxy-2-oxoglutarate aldolase